MFPPMSIDAAATPLRDRILHQLLALHQAGGLALAETGPRSGVFRFGFRAGGWPVTVDLDTTVLELRAYYAGTVEVVATGPVPERIMQRLTSPRSGGVDGAKAKAAKDELRRIVAEWKNRNARIFMRPPAVARHPDGWNNA